MPVSISLVLVVVMLPSCRNMFFSSNQLHGCIPASIADSSTQYLDLSDNNFGCTIPASLASSPNLA